MRTVDDTKKSLGSLIFIDLFLTRHT
uniref:Uncharacterized protein n=1 Tax=Musa acuminata subsp. malaccensis TaxID=214687 RepID=A0A804IHX3_MUSAM